MAATKLFADRAKRAKEGKGAMPPGNHMFTHGRPWCVWPWKTRRLPKEHRNGAVNPEAMLHSVSVCRLRKAYDRDTMKVFFSVHRKAEAELSSVKKGLVAQGAKEKMGQAPRAGLEREVQEVIDDLTATYT